MTETAQNISIESFTNPQILFFLYFCETEFIGFNVLTFSIKNQSNNQKKNQLCILKNNCCNIKIFVPLRTEHSLVVSNKESNCSSETN